MVNVFFDGGEAGESFSFAESGVHKEAGALRLQQGDVAGAAGSENSYAQADRFPQKIGKSNFRMMAERGKSVNKRDDSGRGRIR